MQGGPSTATRRTKLKEHADGYHSGASQRNCHRSKVEEQCRKSRHQVMRRRSSVEGVDTTQEAQGCQAGEAPEQYSMKKVLPGERAGAASLAMLRQRYITMLSHHQRSSGSSSTLLTLQLVNTLET